MTEGDDPADEATEGEDCCGATTSLHASDCPKRDDPADDVIAASEYRDPGRDQNRDLREWLGRDPTDDELERWIRRGFTDVIAEGITDGIEREPEVNRWVGGDTSARVLDFGEVFHEGRTLRITVELVRAADPPDMPPGEAADPPDMPPGEAADRG